MGLTSGNAKSPPTYGFVSCCRSARGAGDASKTAAVTSSLHGQGPPTPSCCLVLPLDWSRPAPSLSSELTSLPEKSSGSPSIPTSDGVSSLLPLSSSMPLSCWPSPHTPQNRAGVVSSLGSLNHQETFGHIILLTGLISPYRGMVFLEGSAVKNPPVSQKPGATWIQSLG